MMLTGAVLVGIIVQSDANQYYISRLTVQSDSNRNYISMDFISLSLQINPLALEMDI